MINFRWLGFMLFAAGAPLSVYSEAEPLPAPEPLLGYGAQASAEADAQVPQVSQIIESAAAGIDKAAADFERELAGSHRP